MTKPAMTVDQWAQWLGDEAQTRIEDANGDVLVLCRDMSGKKSEAGGTNHAIAASALHNKPFGFTAFDIIMLRSRASACLYEEEGMALASIADRIEALLAPAEVTQ